MKYLIALALLLPLLGRAETAAPPTAPSAASAPVRAPIPFKRETLAPSESASGALGILAVSLLGIGALWLVRRRLMVGAAVAAQPGALRITETRRLGPKAQLSVVEFDGGRYLISLSEQGVTCLVSRPGAVEPAQAGA